MKCHQITLNASDLRGMINICEEQEQIQSYYRLINLKTNQLLITLATVSNVTATLLMAFAKPCFFEK